MIPSMRIIAHLDMDAFFAAVEEKDNPNLQGLPVAVGADPRNGRGRGVVATANYAARAYGLRSALPISQAWHLSEQARRQGRPAVVFLAPRFERYVEISGDIYSIARNHLSEIERAGIDEMYLEMSVASSYERAAEISRDIKQEIWQKERLTASIGVGPNKLIAKIASDQNKPDGLTVIREEDAEKFLEPLSIRKLPGIGPKTEARLNAVGFRTIGQLKSASADKLEEILGRWGSDLLEMARGLDDSPVEESTEVKSVSEQETFLDDTLEVGFIISRLKEMAEHVFARLEGEEFQGFRTAVLVIRFADFETKTKSLTLKNAVFSSSELSTIALQLLMPFLDRRLNPKLKRVRLIGLRLQKLVKAGAKEVATSGEGDSP